MDFLHLVQKQLQTLSAYCASREASRPSPFAAPSLIRKDEIKPVSGDDIPWKWMCSRILEILANYPTGVTPTTLFSELSLQWEADKKNQWKVHVQKLKKQQQQQSAAASSPAASASLKPSARATMSLNDVHDSSSSNQDSSSSIPFDAILSLRVVPSSSSPASPIQKKYNLLDETSSKVLEYLLPSRFLPLEKAQSAFIISPERTLLLTSVYLRNKCILPSTIVLPTLSPSTFASDASYISSISPYRITLSAVRSKAISLLSDDMKFRANSTEIWLRSTYLVVKIISINKLNPLGAGGFEEQREEDDLFPRPSLSVVDASTEEPVPLLFKSASFAASFFNLLRVGDELLVMNPMATISGQQQQWFELHWSEERTSAALVIGSGIRSSSSSVAFSAVASLPEEDLGMDMKWTQQQMKIQDVKFGMTNLCLLGRVESIVYDKQQQLVIQLSDIESGHVISVLICGKEDFNHLFLKQVGSGDVVYMENLCTIIGSQLAAGKGDDADMDGGVVEWSLHASAKYESKVHNISKLRAFLTSPFLIPCRTLALDLSSPSSSFPFSDPQREVAPIVFVAKAQIMEWIFADSSLSNDMVHLVHDVCGKLPVEREDPSSRRNQWYCQFCKCEAASSRVWSVCSERGALRAAIVDDASGKRRIVQVSSKAFEDITTRSLDEFVLLSNSKKKAVLNSVLGSELLFLITMVSDDVWKVSGCCPRGLAAESVLFESIMK